MKFKTYENLCQMRVYHVYCMKGKWSELQLDSHSKNGRTNILYSVLLHQEVFNHNNVSL